MSSSNAASFLNHLSGPASRQNDKRWLVADDVQWITSRTSPRLRSFCRVPRSCVDAGTKRPRLRIVEVDRIGGRGRIEALLHQIELALLERAGHLDLAAACAGTAAAHIRAGCAQRCACRPARSQSPSQTIAAMPARPSRPGTRDAVDVGVADAGERVDRLGHLGGRDVLALPAEGVADAIDEIEIAVARPCRIRSPVRNQASPLLEHVAQDLVLVLGGGGIALEAVAGLATDR